MMVNQNDLQPAAILPNEVRLLELLAAGDMEAFEALYDHYQPRLRLFIAPFVNFETDRIAEILQEVFIRLWTRRELLVGVEVLEYYLQRMAKNYLLDLVRSQLIRDKHEQRFAAGLSGEAAGTEEGLLLKEYHRLAREAILQMPLRRQDIFRLSALEGYSLDEIGEMTGLSKEIVKKQLFKARRSIREHLCRKGGFSLPLGSRLLLLPWPLLMACGDW